MPPQKTTTRRKRTKWTKKQLDILYECWKNAESNKERIELVEEKLPKIPPLAALNKMRSMAKSDSKWLSMSTRKKNQVEKEKLQVELEKERKRKEREQKKEERKQRKKEREEKKKERSIIKAHKTLKERLKENLKCSHFEMVEEKIENEVFFCPKIQQFMSNISCIFRIFSNDYGFSVGGPCEKCKLMDAHIPIIQEVIKNGRQKRAERNKTSARSESKKEESSAGTTIASAKARKTSGSTKRIRRKKTEG